MGPSHNDIAENTSAGKAPAAVNPEAAPGLKIPAILLEGDEPAPLPEGTSQEPKIALGTASNKPETDSQEAGLPLAYSTGRLWLTPRDPHGLYAHWDLPQEQQQHYNKLAHQHHLALRIHLDSLGGRPLVEMQLSPETRHLFVPVAFPGRGYVAELGYYPVDHEWKSVAVSDLVATPQEGISQDKTVHFATIPTLSHVSPAPQSPSLKPGGASGDQPTRAFPLVVRARPASEPLASAPPTSQETRFPDRSAEASVELGFTPAPDWTPQQEQALGELIDSGRPGSPSSAEIIEVLQGRVSELEAAIRSIQLSVGHQFSSPAGGEVPSPKDFWLSVNAELVIYGATLPSARVTIGGHPIQLRPDGTFSYRFALPDGHYELPIEAAATDGDLRRAILEFYRRTRCQDEVRSHPQSPQLRNPEAGTNG